MNSLSEEYAQLRRLWFRRVFWWLMLLGFLAIEAYLIFAKTGGFSNTDNQIALAVERTLFGSMFMLPLLMPVWAFVCFLICNAGLRIHANRKKTD